jgi:hypothetical protein
VQKVASSSGETKVACDEGQFEDVSQPNDVQQEEGEVGAASLLQMQQNLHLWCYIQNQQEWAELYDNLCLPFYQSDANGDVTIVLV